MNHFSQHTKGHPRGDGRDPVAERLLNALVGLLESALPVLMSDNDLTNDDLEIEDTDLLDPTDDEPVFDELQPGDLSGDDPIELQ